jgi:hypothetical protein
MKIPIFTGVAAGVVVALTLGFVTLVRTANESTRQTEAAFKLACESTGGKAVWNFKYWECLK